MNRIVLTVVTCLAVSCTAAGQTSPGQDADQRDLSELREKVRDLEMQNAELSRKVKRLFQMVEALSAAPADSGSPAAPDKNPSQPPAAESPGPAAELHGAAGEPLLRLEEIGQIQAPGNLVQLLISEPDGLMFVRNAGSRIWVVDLKAGQTIDDRAPTRGRLAT